ncbi:hypothetical protein [Albimonas pacifica]|uniref:Uncharacterized protein n=1 Tax=Albimonas pacifica TaxID=1114924 RepID=A0A1I3LGG3_9RHOB|nr:hypothetical protein [Albimonas pacifica]SFI83801.1 hypothetical protein SAMN05216258_11014 [Albimonas pacifica]
MTRAEKLRALMDKVRERGPMTEAQRRSFVAAEAAFGSDADEAAFNRALADRDWPEVERLEKEAYDRAAAILRALAEEAAE